MKPILQLLRDSPVLGKKKYRGMTLFEMHSSETRQIQEIGTGLNTKHMQVQNETGQAVWRSLRPLLACHNQYSMKKCRNLVKRSKFGNKMSNLVKMFRIVITRTQVNEISHQWRA